MYVETAIAAFVSLFVVIDPLGNLPIFIALTGDVDAAARRRLALRGCLIGFLVLLAFALGGAPFLDVLGIGLPAFRIAGGVMLFLIALEMVFERRASRRRQTAKRVADERQPDTTPAAPADIAVFPLAVPLLAGPGSITTVLLLMGQDGGDLLHGIIIVAVVFAVLALTLALLLLAAPIERLLGATVTLVLSRLFGIVLAALAVQFILDGLKSGLLA